MKKIIAIAILAGVTLLHAQNAKPATPKSAAVTVKSSAAEDALVQAAKDLQADQQTITQLIAQARATSDSEQKDLQQQIAAKNQALLEKLRADKKYKPFLDELDGLQKQLQQEQVHLQETFGPRIQAAQVKIQQDQALVNGLIPVVRKENGLPDSAVFDAATQTWKQ